MLLADERAIAAVFATKNVIGVVQTMHGLCYVKDQEIRELMVRHQSGEFDDKRKLQRWVRNKEAPAVSASDKVGKEVITVRGSFEGLKALVA